MSTKNSPLHRLSLAIPGEVIWQTAFVAAGTATCSTLKTSPEAPVTSTGWASSSTTHSWVGAVAGKMAREVAGVATTAGSSATQAEGRAVSLHVAKSLADIAQLGYLLFSPSSERFRGTVN